MSIVLLHVFLLSLQSFDEDGLQGDTCRRSSLLTDIQGGGATVEGVRVTLTKQNAIEGTYTCTVHLCTSECRYPLYRG